MTLPKSHFYVRSRKDAFPDNPGAHPLIAVKVENGLIYVAACSPKDRFSKRVARDILNGRIATQRASATADGTDTISLILSDIGVPRKLLKVADLDRASIAFERALEA